MENALSWLVLVALVIGGAYIYLSSRASQSNQQASQSQKRLSQINTTLNHFADLAGKGIQTKLTAGDAPNIALKNGEHLLCVFSNTTLLEPRAVRTWRSAYGGPAIRVAKGLSFRFGQSRGVSESHDELRAIDTGTLLLTNERLVFIGSQRTSSNALKDIIDIEGRTDGVMIHRKGKQRIEGYQFSDAMQMNYQYDGQTLAAPMDGQLVKAGILEAITFQDPAVRSLVSSTNGDMLLAQGNVSEALQAYRESLDIREHLVKANPNDADSQRALAGCYERVGDALFKQGDHGEALKSYRRGLAVGERLAETHPGSAASQNVLLASYHGLGKALFAQGDHGGALKFYRKGVAVAEHLAEADPGSAASQRALVLYYDSVGDALKAQGNLGDALNSYRKGLTSGEGLAKADPSKTTTKSDLVISFEMGGAPQAQGDIPQNELRYAGGKIGGLSWSLKWDDLACAR